MIKKCKNCGKEYKSEYWYKKHISKCNKSLVLSDKKKDFLEIFEKTNGLISLSAKLMKVSRQTVYNWMDKDDNFKIRIKDIQERTIDWVESKLYELINEGDRTSIIFFLKTRAKDRGYIERPDVLTQDNIQINIVPAKNKKDKDE